MFTFYFLYYILCGFVKSDNININTEQNCISAL